MASQVENADRILDELEEVAHSSVPNAVFVDQVLDSLRSLLRADGSALVVAVQDDRWAALAIQGKLGQDALFDLSSAIASIDLKPSPAGFLRGTCKSGQSWIAHPIQSMDYRLGCLVIGYAQPIPAAAEPAVVALLKAFCEIMAVRQIRRSEKFLQEVGGRVQEIANELLVAREPAVAAHTFAYRLCSILGASRVTLFRDDGFPLRSKNLLSVSNATSPDRRSEAVERLRSLAEQARTSEQPLVQYGDSPVTTPSHEGRSKIALPELAPCYLATRWAGLPKELGRGYLIVLEWSDRTAMVESLPALAHALPFLTTILAQQDRWLSVPTWMRKGGDWLGRGLIPRLGRSSVRWLILAVLCAGVLWLLQKPTPLIIEAEAIIEPTTKRSIYVHVDGLLEKLLVNDGEAVVEGQPLATLRSPTLDLEIEEVVGQIRAIAEKRNGLRVAVSQVSSASADAESVQTRLSAEILLLEEQEKHAREKLDFLNEERKKLAILAPIAGTIVSRNMARELESRPLRRGDSLFTIVDLDGPWQLQIQVADRDSEYVLRSREGGKDKVDFVLDSMPKESHQATIQYVGRSIENPKGDHCFLPVFASLDHGMIGSAYIGANARVRFTCDDQPYWFVWCRPIWETLQQRYGLFTETRNE